MVNVPALLSGLAGAAALTTIHESVRQGVPTAPRMDLLGMQAIEHVLHALGRSTPGATQLHRAALGGDLLANGLYYSLVGAGRPSEAPLRGALLGLAAGLGAIVLPKPLGLSDKPSSRTTSTQAMTLAWYLAGGLAAGLAYKLLSGDDEA
jgi:hypothetical protein